MCGIAGVFHADQNVLVDRARLKAMGDALYHRGPDESAVHVGPGYGLAHQRLAIVDLADGQQPMAEPGGRLWVCYNGEVYNHEDLRRELEAEGYQFRTRCDTEVLLHGYRAWGEALPERLRGMFAFAIVDEREQTMFCARDRLGKKPFYYSEVDAGILFASEPKGILAYGGVSRTLDPEAIAQFFCLRYVPDPKTAFLNIRRLPPGHRMTVSAAGIRIAPYWKLSFAQIEDRSIEDLSEEVLERLDEAVRIRLMGEVPLGAFLSGGIDSYAIVESMTRASKGRVVACTMGFENSSLDERHLARAAAEACGAELHEEAIGTAAMLDQDWFDGVFDEPFADASAVPTYHVSKLARKHVTVALSGDGGDESFGGYRRYKYDIIEARMRKKLPRGVWAALGLLYPKVDFLPRYLRFKRTFQNLARDPAEAYARSVSANLPEEVRGILRGEWLEAAGDPLRPLLSAYASADGPDALSRAAHTDFQTWLPGDILTKVDRASMAVSLEVRAPFLDHVLIEAAAKIPSALKMLDGETKGFLRHVLAGRLGKAALKRPKQGFHVPAREWLCGSLGDSLLSALGGPLEEIVDCHRVRELLLQHRKGIRDHSELLWATLALSRFLRRWAQ